VGNAVRQIPPLRLVQVREYQAVLDKKPKTDAEKRGQRGLHRDKRRPSRKVSSDMRFLCRYIEAKASEAGLNPSDQTLENVQRMFKAAEKEVSGSGSANPRNGQLKWRTLVAKIRKRLKEERDAGST
jgi:hypothetical protein